MEATTENGQRGCAGYARLGTGYKWFIEGIGENAGMADTKAEALHALVGALIECGCYETVIRLMQWECSTHDSTGAMLYEHPE